jgi:hypothetical protein
MFDERMMFQDRREVNAAIIYETRILKISIENIKYQFLDGPSLIGLHCFEDKKKKIRNYSTLVFPC